MFGVEIIARDGQLFVCFGLFSFLFLSFFLKQRCDALAADALATTVVRGRIGVGFVQRMGLHATSRRAAQLVSGAQGCLEEYVGARGMTGWFIQLTRTRVTLLPVRALHPGCVLWVTEEAPWSAGQCCIQVSVAESIYRKECDHNKPVIVCVCNIYLKFSAAAFHLMRHFREAPEYLGRVGVMRLIQSCKYTQPAPLNSTQRIRSTTPTQSVRCSADANANADRRGGDQPGRPVVCVRCRRVARGGGGHQGRPDGLGRLRLRPRTTGVRDVYACLVRC